MGSSRLLGQLTETASTGVVRWLEVCVLSVSIPVLGLLLNRTDPFFLHSDIPLLAIAPALIGLRYGVSLALFSAAGIIGSASLTSSLLGVPPLGPSVGLSLSTVFAAIVCGQFRDSWDRERARYDLEQAYQSARLEQITHSYGILLASHAKLEQRLLGQTVSLRAALTAVREKLMVASLTDGDARQYFAETILDLFAEYGHVQAGAVYRCMVAEGPRRQGSNGCAHFSRLAERGSPPALSRSNPLLREVLSSDKTAVAAAHQLVVTEGLHAIVPIHLVEGQLWGLVCVGEVGALDFSHKTYELLTLIADYVADGLHPHDSGQDDRGARDRICVTIDRWSRTASRQGLSVTLLVLRGDNRLRLTAVGEVLRARSRALDHVWLWEGDSGRRRVVALLPLTTVESALALVQRVEDEVRERGGIALAEAGIEVDAIAINGHDSSAALLERLERASSRERALSQGLALTPLADG